MNSDDISARLTTVFAHVHFAINRVRQCFPEESEQRGKVIDYLKSVALDVKMLKDEVDGVDPPKTDKSHLN